MRRKISLLAAIVMTILSACATGTDGTAPQEAGASRGATRSSEPTPQGASAPADTSEITKEELPTQGNGTSIYGYVTAPANYRETRLPAIIYSHGFGGMAERGDGYARAMAARGYIVYSFDFRGGNPASRSGGDTLQMSVFTEQDDLDVVVSFLAQQPFVDSDAIFLMARAREASYRRWKRPPNRARSGGWC
jgi:alpha/beta superfamily hydrolase